MEKLCKFQVFFNISSKGESMDANYVEVEANRETISLGSIINIYTIEFECGDEYLINGE